MADYLPDAAVTARDEWRAYIDRTLDCQERLRRALHAIGGVPELAAADLSGWPETDGA